MKRKVPDYKKILTPSDLELNTCSNQDCTGLIPTAVKNPAEADSYEELYPYITVVSPTLQDNPNKINADTKKETDYKIQKAEYIDLQSHKSELTKNGN